MKIDSSLSVLSICYFFSRFRKPIIHKEFFGIISRNPEYVKTNCNDFYNSFHFACQKWIRFNQTNQRHNVNETNLLN